MYTSGTLLCKECLEGPGHTLSNRRVIEVRLPADRFDPALLAMEGDALGLPLALGRSREGRLPTLTPVQEFRERSNLWLGQWTQLDLGWAVGKRASG